MNTPTPRAAQPLPPARRDSRRAARRSAAAGLAGALTCLGLAAGVPQVASSATTPTQLEAGRAPGDRRWLAIGDSISSGFGITSISRRASLWDQQCYRADGVEPVDTAGGRAWPVVAYGLLRERGRFVSQQFSACSGAITDDWIKQLAEASVRAGVTIRSEVTSDATPERTSPLVRELVAAAAAGRRWDLVTVTMGANNVEFGDFVRRCLNVADPQGQDLTWSSESWDSCGQAQLEIQRQIDVLVGRVPVDATHRLGQGRVPLWAANPAGGAVEPLYSVIARFVNPGGRVLVMGYPQLVEEPARTVLAGRWKEHPGLLTRAGSCEGIAFADIPRVRAVVSYLNAALAEAVRKAGAANPTVSFEFLDPNPTALETPQGRHSLCTRLPWTNGMQPGLGGALHPNAAGHKAMGEVVARQLSAG
ncbi:MAG: hypothetical protein IPI32_01625 [Austwickia sp.]|jgi:hypothetical protein|nr:hypothetical protein [Austwickia sp.]MBK8437660.1 hypothetical protein [Austwickia sp.]